jgi:hypothetical protein
MNAPKITLNIGQNLIHISKFSKYTVTSEDEYCYYLTIFKGTCSDIKTITKRDPFDKFKTEWFFNTEEMLKQRIKNSEERLSIDKKLLEQHLSEEITQK